MTYHTMLSIRSCFSGLALGSGLFLMACSWIPKGEPQLDIGIKDRGVASWYGAQFHGKQAADGTIYDMKGFTAAHRTFPLGSMVRVVNLTNGKYLFVRITDRGPYVNGRILDLSRAAAVRLGMDGNGLALVQAEIVGERRPDALVSSDAIQALGHARMIGTGSMHEAVPHLFTSPFRTLPSDLWRQRRSWRVSGMPAVDHMAHAERIALILT